MTTVTPLLANSAYIFPQVPEIKKNRGFFPLERKQINQDAVVIAYKDVREAFHGALKSRPEIREHNIPFYHKWARDYLEWCSAARREPGEISSAGEFAGMLHEAGKPEFQIRQARRAMEMQGLSALDLKAPTIPTGQIPRGTWTAGRQGLSHTSVGGTGRFRRDAMPGVQRLAVFFSKVLEKEFSGMSGIPRPERKRRITVVLGRDETVRLLARHEPPYDLLGGLMYGGSLRLFEAVGLRVQDLDFDSMRVLVQRHGIRCGWNGSSSGAATGDASGNHGLALIPGAARAGSPAPS